jgi:hypothetical protein
MGSVWRSRARWSVFAIVGIGIGLLAWAPSSDAAPVAAAVAVSAPSVREYFPFSTTTTLAKETGNNTSASSSFSGTRNKTHPEIVSNIVPGNVSDVPTRSLLYNDATTKIYAHVMPWFGPGRHDNYLQVGYRSDDAVQAMSQVDDMGRRGIDGMIIDWYGDPSRCPNDTLEANGTTALMHAAEQHAGFTFALMLDGNIMQWCGAPYPTPAAPDPTALAISELQYAASTYLASPAYLHYDDHGVSKPVIFAFDTGRCTGVPPAAPPFPHACDDAAHYRAVDWTRVKAQPQFANLLVIEVNAGAFTSAGINGAYSWVYARDGQDPTIWGEADFQWFFQHADADTSRVAVGGTYKGFDGSPTPPEWSGNKLMYQDCGQVWLKTFAEIGKYRNSGNQLPMLQLVTWNDYEEGTEIETGIDNCVSINTTLNDSTLTWTITGQENTLHNYTIYASQDGQNLAVLLDDVPPSQRSVDLASFRLAPGSYTIYVKAVGQPSLLNHMSDSVSFASSAAMAPAFLEQGGRVMMAAEHAHDAISRSGHAWRVNIQRPAYLGTGAMFASPDNNLQIAKEAMLTTSPMLGYRVRFSTTGIYDVWVRALRDDPESDSIYVGLDGQSGDGQPDKNGLSLSFRTTDPVRNWFWLPYRFDIAGVVTLAVRTIGEHTINVWMREDGFRFDRLYLTVDSGAGPTGAGLPESPRVVSQGVAGCPAFGGVATAPMGDGGCKLDASFVVVDVIPAGWKALYWNGSGTIWATAGDTIHAQTASFYRLEAPTATPTTTATPTSTSTPATAPTATQTLRPVGTGEPTQTPIPTPAPSICAPRPTTGLHVAPAGADRLSVDVSSTTYPATPGNRIQSLRLTPPPNADVEVGSPSGPSFTVTTPDGSTLTRSFYRGTGGATFTVTLPSMMQQPPPVQIVRTGPGPVTVTVVLHDSCGDWPTFVGGGASAF